MDYYRRRNVPFDSKKTSYLDFSLFQRRSSNRGHKILLLISNIQWWFLSRKWSREIRFRSWNDEQGQLARGWARFKEISRNPVTRVWETRLLQVARETSSWHERMYVASFPDNVRLCAARKNPWKILAGMDFQKYCVHRIDKAIK